MRSNKVITSEITALTTLKKVIDSYQEIASIRMRKVRQHVLTNRDFLSGLNDIHWQVRSLYKKYKRPKDEEVMRPTNGRTLSILLSSNTGLYGDITRKVFDLFYNEVKKTDTDLVIVGRFGKKFYDSSDLKRPYQYFDFSDSGTDVINSKELLKYVITFENILVYHGFFEDILSQVALRTAVTGGSFEKAISDLESSPEKDADQKWLGCIFEPSVQQVLSFFESQILSSIFEQTIFESSLSKFSSRMISLDFASNNLKKSLIRTNFKFLKAKHKAGDDRQLGLMSGMSLWGMQV
jgi:F0F1-type ATP synthase gamma subunit